MTTYAATRFSRFTAQTGRISASLLLFFMSRRTVRWGAFAFPQPSSGHIATLTQANPMISSLSALTALALIVSGLGRDGPAGWSDFHGS